MPELPEVETVARRMAPLLVGQTITAVEVSWKRSVDRPVLKEFINGLCGKSFISSGRRGKYLVFGLAPIGHLLVHLRMSGDLLVVPVGAERAKHEHVILTLSNGTELRFEDPRKFGRMYFVEHPDEVVGTLGPEPLDGSFGFARFFEGLQQKRGLIKPLLLDQRFIAGLGNIYVVESLWRSGIHPMRVASSIQEQEARKLFTAIRAILKTAVERQGTDIGDGVWKQGDYNPRAYGRVGKKCFRCGDTVQRMVLAQRGTEFCLTCQPLRRRRVKPR